jgi:3-dehydroquinate dehydratase-2
MTTLYYKRALLINGPNVNLLGIREVKTYGTLCMVNLFKALTKEAFKRGIKLIHSQSGSEDILIAKVHSGFFVGTSFMIINPSAFTHYSVGIRDALLSTSIPFIEVHLSHIRHREAFRELSLLSDVAVSAVLGCGWKVYFMALLIYAFHSFCFKG